MPRSVRLPSLRTLLILAAIFPVALVGWLKDPSGVQVAGARADWQPSPIPKNWEAPVLPTPTSTRPAGSATAATATATRPGATATAATSPTAASGATSGTATVARTATPGGTGTPGTTPARTATPAGTATQAQTATAGRTASPAAQATQTPQPAQRGQWREETLQSRVLDRRLPYLVWLPPGYPAAGKKYSVVYLLHGGGDGENPGRAEWRVLGLADALDQATADGDLPRHIIFVLPEGLQGYWINHAGGGPRWADYVVEDVVPHIDRTFATDARPERRAIGGLSMGGHGALQLALRHPNVFRIAGAHSPALRDHKESPPFFGDAAWFARFDPLTLARASRDAGRLTVWLDVGQQDRWREDVEQLGAALEKGGARVEQRSFPGRHEGSYWRAHVRDYLKFYGFVLG